MDESEWDREEQQRELERVEECARRAMLPLAPMIQQQRMIGIASNIYARLMSQGIMQGPALQGGQPQLSFFPARQCAEHALACAMIFDEALRRWDETHTTAAGTAGAIEA